RSPRLPAQAAIAPARARAIEVLIPCPPSLRGEGRYRPAGGAATTCARRRNVVIPPRARGGVGGEDPPATNGEKRRNVKARSTVTGSTRRAGPGAALAAGCGTSAAACRGRDPCR